MSEYVYTITITKDNPAPQYGNLHCSVLKFSEVTHPVKINQDSPPGSDGNFAAKALGDRVTHSREIILPDGQTDLTLFFRDGRYLPCVGSYSINGKTYTHAFLHQRRREKDGTPYESRFVHCVHLFDMSGAQSTMTVDDSHATLTSKTPMKTFDVPYATLYPEKEPVIEDRTDVDSTKITFMLTGDTEIGSGIINRDLNWGWGLYKTSEGPYTGDAIDSKRPSNVEVMVDTSNNAYLLTEDMTVPGFQIGGPSDLSDKSV